MPRLKNCLICPKCGQQGGTIGKRPVKDHVQLPNKESIMNLKTLDSGAGTRSLVAMKLSVAFDFVAKAFLALETHAIMYPDPSDEREDSRADAMYKDLQAFDPHSEIRRQEFEAKWLDEPSPVKRISQRVKNDTEMDEKQFKDSLRWREKRYAETGYQGSFMDGPLEQRIRKPTAVHMHISRYSISLRYAAILFTALSHLAADLRLPSFLYERESLYALAIYSVFNSLRYMIDGRSRRPMKDWSRIIDARIVHGYNAASSLTTSRPAALCSRCYSQGIENIPPMGIRLKDDGSTEWCCNRCGGTETLRRRLTAENIKKRECKVASDIELLLEYAPFYADFKQMFSSFLETSSKLREDLAREFDRQEIESHKLSFHTHYSYFIQHHDPDKKSKIRCSIPKNDVVKIIVTDLTYREYIRLLTNSPTELAPEYLNLLTECIGRLKELIFPMEYAYDKVEYDMKMHLSND